MRRRVEQVFSGQLWSLVKERRSVSTAARGTLCRAVGFGVPFEVTESEAKERFESWHRASWFSPRSLAQLDDLRIQPCYFPFWCFESEMGFSYSAVLVSQSGPDSKQQNASRSGRLSTESFSFHHPQMQVYASFKHRRDFAEAAKVTCLTKKTFELEGHQGHMHGVAADAPNVRQGMAWELALRNVRKLKQDQLEEQLKSEKEVVGVEDLHLDIKVFSRRAKLYYFPTYVVDYTFLRSYSAGGELQQNKFQTVLGGTVDGGVLGERHYCPRKARFAASCVGAGVGASFVAMTDAPLSVSVAETTFWTFMMATLTGLYAKYNVIFDRWHQIHKIDWEHQQFTKEYFKDFDREKDQAFSDYQDFLRCEDEWSHWENLHKWNWKEQERRRWGESLWRDQHRRRRDNHRFKLKQKQERIQREQEEQREERRRRRYGSSGHFHHHGQTGFAWSHSGGGSRDALGYYALLSLDPTGSWTDGDIKEAFQKQAMQWHPDLHAVNAKESAKRKPDLKQRHERFQSLREAYEVLRDPKKKELYDRGQLLKNQI